MMQKRQEGDNAGRNLIQTLNVDVQCLLFKVQSLHIVHVKNTFLLTKPWTPYQSYHIPYSPQSLHLFILFTLTFSCLVFSKSPLSVTSSLLFLNILFLSVFRQICFPSFSISLSQTHLFLHCPLRSLPC